MPEVILGTPGRTEPLRPAMQLGAGARYRSARPHSPKLCAASRVPISSSIIFMQFQYKTFHLPITAMTLPYRHQPATPSGILSQAELRRIVADMVD